MTLKNIKKLHILILTGTVILSNTVQAQGQQQERTQHRDRHDDLSADIPVNVVSSLPSYASIARYIGGDLVTVESIASGSQDPHFVQPKPSYALMLTDADLFLTTGLDLELWVPPLLDKARNEDIFEGAIGFVSVATNLPLLDKAVVNPDRSMGDIHLYGNPHIHTSLLNGKIIAENILIGLKKVAPEYADTFDANYRSFVDRIDRSMFGDELVDLLGGEVLTRMLMSGTLIEFLETNEYGGEVLIDRLGGLLKEGMPFRGAQVICYHKNWSYFARDFGVDIVDYIEPKPGIPPTAKHVKEVIEKIEAQNIKVMLVANHFEKNSPMMISQRTGIKAVFIPLDVGGGPGVDTYFDLIDCWVKALNEAFAEAE